MHASSPLLPSDLPHTNAPAISIILPVLNEARQLSNRLAALLAQTAGHACEIIVVDGGSQDQTPEIAAGFPVQLVTAERANRGWQMNAGARNAQNEVLLFLHADVQLPAGAFQELARALGDENVVGGCFQIRFPAEAPRSLHLVAWGINWRTRWFRTATGDQAIFVRRDVFAALGGFQPLPLMEDIAMFHALKRRGNVAILDAQVVISPRRWLQFGIWRTVLLMYALRAGYWLGISPATLKRFFVDVR